MFADLLNGMSREKWLHLIGHTLTNVIKRKDFCIKLFPFFPCVNTLLTYLVLFKKSTASIERRPPGFHAPLISEPVILHRGKESFFHYD